MTRDGALKSLWQIETEKFIPATKPVDADTIYDVLVVGGGITGLTAALLLQSAGKQCVLAEAFNIGFGTSGGTTAHLNTVLDTPYYQIESDFGEDNARLVAVATQESIQLVDELCRHHNIDCGFSYKKGYLFAQDQDEEEMLDKIVNSSAKAGIKITYTPEVPVPISHSKACVFDGQAQFDIGKYLTGLAKAFEVAGGIILDNCTVTSVDSASNHTITTSKGEIKAQYLVYATHIPPGVNLLHFRCAPYRSYAAAVTLSTGNYPENLVYDLKEPYHYFRTQEVDGKKYMIAGGFDHKTGHNENTEQSFRELEAYLREHFSIESIAYKWSSQYYTAADGLPYIGRLPGSNGDVLTGTGYLGNGMTFGTLAGKILSDIILGKESPYEKLFDPNRIKPVAGFMEFVKENADVISKFIGMRFSYEQLNSLAELAPGDAMLADYENAKIALYKNEQGKLFALDPVCPHAKCIVAWNNAEKTWDCPCHGGRYNYDGTLLTGPARKGLAPLELNNL